jgi:hypothetical protein
LLRFLSLRFDLPGEPLRETLPEMEDRQGPEKIFDNRQLSLYKFAMIRYFRHRSLKRPYEKTTDAK